VTATFAAPPSMFEQYPSGIHPIEYEANTSWNRSLEITQRAERAEPKTASIKRYILVLYAAHGWKLNELDDLVRPQNFVNRRPGSRPGRKERAELDAMTPAQFLDSFFTERIAFEAAPDDCVWTALLAYAESHYTASHARAAKRMNEAVTRGLAVRAGIEPIAEELIR
jgi:hypothetical protein